MRVTSDRRIHECADDATDVQSLAKVLWEQGHAVAHKVLRFVQHESLVVRTLVLSVLVTELLPMELLHGVLHRKRSYLPVHVVESESCGQLGSEAGVRVCVLSAC